MPASSTSILEIMQGLCFALQTTPRRFSPNFMQFIQFHNEYKILIWLKECFAALWERNIPSEIGHIRDLEGNVSNALFVLSLYVIF